jgi:L-asparaginase/Glu-tRNA(Gln) amidotransferase subunit D
MVLMNGRIHSALLVSKRHVSSIEAFDSGFEGALGEVADGTVRWFRPAHRIKPLALPEGCELPRVDLISAYAGADDVAIKAFIGAGARAIIHAGLGNGNAPPGARETLKRLGLVAVVVGYLGQSRVTVVCSTTTNSASLQQLVFRPIS